MKSLTQALAETPAVVEKTVQTTVQEVTGPKALQDFELLDQVGSGGPGLVWKLYLGRARNKVAHAHNPEVCVWILDKKALADTGHRVGLSKAAEDAFLDVIRADASQLLKLRHLGVLRIVQGLDESKAAAAMSMVTEPIFASVANILGNMENVPVVPKELKGLELGELEIKHGLLQLAETLAFLHKNAQLIHRAISPEAVFLTSSGAWKLASFGYAVNIEQAVTSNTFGKFYYPDYDVEDLVMPLQPQLDYTAPELTQNDGAAQTSSDIFSLACVAYHLLARQPLVQSKNNLRTYTSIALYLGNEKFSKIPFDLSEDLRRMLTPDAFSRPSALDFTGSKFFREDLRLRALRFLDHMLERDNMQKTDFLKALSSMWKEFDARVLRYKVLPPLCAELHNVTMLPMVLPMVLTIAESQEKEDFESSILPALLPVLDSATGDSLLFLVKHAGLLTNKVAAPQMVETIVPMLVRAYDDPDARMQEEVLRRTLSIAKHLDYQVVKQSILPRVHNLALKTTVAAVRVNALMCLGELVQRIDKQALKDVLQTLHRCTEVDHSAPTLMCTLGVATSIYKQYGIEFAAENLLPLLTPLLVTQQLNLQQFMKYMSFIKDILRTIEEKRGIKQGDQEKPVRSSITGKLSAVNQYFSSWIKKRPVQSSSTQEQRLLEEPLLDDIESLESVAKKYEDNVDGRVPDIYNRYARRWTPPKDVSFSTSNIEEQVKIFTERRGVVEEDIRAQENALHTLVFASLTLECLFLGFVLTIHDWRQPVPWWLIYTSWFLVAVTLMLGLIWKILAWRERVIELQVLELLLQWRLQRLKLVFDVPSSDRIRIPLRQGILGALYVKLVCLTLLAPVFAHFLFREI